MGERWEEGTSSSQKLTHAEILLPLKETIFPAENERPANENLNETEPNCIENINNCEIEGRNCCCQNSTKCSSSNLDSNFCKCHVSANKSIKPNNNELNVDSKSVKERHISIDSARDSGIGENSNFADNLDENNEDKDMFHIETGRNPSNTESYTKEGQSSKRFSDLRGYWQPKVKKSLADRLPENSFHLMPPSRYIFPGAEVYYDPDEKLHYEGDSSSSSSSDIDSEGESQTPTVF